MTSTAKVLAIAGALFILLMVRVNGWDKAKEQRAVDGRDTEQDSPKLNEEDMLEEIIIRDRTKDRCMEKKCLHSGHCCQGSVCIEADRNKVGTCLPIYGRREGGLCREDRDCEPGLRCLETEAVDRSCQYKPKDYRMKQYNEQCQTSKECDVTKGLCCQLLRRHRLAPRQICFYFADPESCIGDVDEAHARQMNHMANPFFKARVG